MYPCTLLHKPRPISHLGKKYNLSFSKGASGLSGFTQTTGERVVCWQLNQRNKLPPPRSSNTTKYKPKQRQAVSCSHWIVVASTMGFQRDASLWAYPLAATFDLHPALRSSDYRLQGPAQTALGLLGCEDYSRKSLSRLLRLG